MDARKGEEGKEEEEEGKEEEREREKKKFPMMMMMMMMMKKKREIYKMNPGGAEGEAFTTTQTKNNGDFSRPVFLCCMPTAFSFLFSFFSLSLSTHTIFMFR